MRALFIFLFTSAAFATPYEDYLDSYERERSRYSQEPIIHRSYEPAPAPVFPVQPGSGSSYFSDTQIMTDHQYCYRSVASGAWVCQGH